MKLKGFLSARAVGRSTLASVHSSVAQIKDNIRIAILFWPPNDDIESRRFQNLVLLQDYSLLCFIYTL